MDDQLVGQIGPGLLVLAGIAESDSEATVEAMAAKVVQLRVFEDEQGKMNRSVQETSGSVLAVSQFTLFADCRKGRRPNFMGAAPATVARTLFEHFVRALRTHNVPVETGMFQAMMEVELVNWGPVTITIDSQNS